jgi:hypothetical protein
MTKLSGFPPELDRTWLTWSGLLVENDLCLPPFPAGSQLRINSAVRLCLLSLRAFNIKAAECKTKLEKITWLLKHLGVIEAPMPD